MPRRRDLAEPEASTGRLQQLLCPADMLPEGGTASYNEVRRMLPSLGLL